MDEYARSYSFRTIRTGNLNSETTYPKSAIDTLLTALISFLLCLVLTFVIFIRVHISTNMTKIGYKITELTKEKIRLMEERDRLNAEIAHMKSYHHLNTLLNKNLDFVTPTANKMIKVK